MSESTLTEIYDLLSEIISPENKIKTVDQVNEKELLKLVQHISKEYFKQKKHTDSIISKLKISGLFKQLSTSFHDSISSGFDIKFLK
jgi:hypothetical protein